MTSLQRLMDSDHSIDPSHLYEQVQFPDPPPDRPYCYINMCSSIDGKIVIGKPTGSAAGLGSATDQMLFRRLQLHCDAAMIGSSTLRASQVHYPEKIQRYVVTHSGNIPSDNRFFTEAPDRAFVIAPTGSKTQIQVQRSSLMYLYCGEQSVDLVEAMRMLRQEQGVKHLLCEGGGTLNEQMIKLGLVDELFLTIASKLKGGASLPTIMGGQGFPEGEFATANLVSIYRDDSELYLRYKINPASNELINS